jgi:pimeloyl-ACP methyl ester carboxylesterase
MPLTRFRIDVPDEVLADLRTRVGRTRYTQASSSTPWAAGTDPGYLRSLMEYWADGFDWRRAEAELNALPHYLADVGGQRIHFLHFPAVGAPDALPLIVTHGWPSCFTEMLRLVGPLTDPARFGGDPSDAFDVVVPSLPGFLYSELPPERPMTRETTAQTWHALMTDVLGFRRYGAFGGDIGAAVSAWLGALHPESVVGVHTIHPTAPTNVENLTEEEKAWLAALEAWDRSEGGYSAMMVTRPDTVAAALQDSPAGLAAWIVEKYRAWSDCGGDLESRFDRDYLLTVLTLYWATGTIGSSFRQYYDSAQTPERPPVTVPAGVTMSTEPLFRDLPRSMAERTFPDLRHWRGPTKGGHFMALEEPELLATDMRTFFRPLRSQPVP